MNEPKDHTQRPLETLSVELLPFASGRVNQLTSEDNTYIAIGVSAYDQKFSQEAKLEESQGHTVLADTYQVLALITHFHFVAGNVKEPFQPLFRQGNTRSPIPEDFTEEQISRIDGVLSARLHENALAPLVRLPREA